MSMYVYLIFNRFGIVEIFNIRTKKQANNIGSRRRGSLQRIEHAFCSDLREENIPRGAVVATVFGKFGTLRWQANDFAGPSQYSGQRLHQISRTKNSTILKSCRTE